MIKLIKWVFSGFKTNRRNKTERRVNHVQAEISDLLADSSGNDFPLLTKRGTGRRSEKGALCY